MFIPSDYKSLRSCFSSPFTPRTLAFLGNKERFRETPFYNFIRRGASASTLECPICEELCLVDDEGDGRYVMYCEACDEFHTLTTRDIERCLLDVEALIYGIAKANNLDCKACQSHWFLGKPFLAGAPRNLYFSPFPNDALIQTLIHEKGSILLTFNANPNAQTAYPQQLFTLADLQVSESSLALNLDKICAPVTPRKRTPIAPNNETTEQRKKALISLLDAEIRRHQYALHHPEYHRFKRYKLPSLRNLAERLKRDYDVTTTHATIRNIVTSKNATHRLIRALYLTLLDEDLTRNYKDIPHLKAILTVNR